MKSYSFYVRYHETDKMGYVYHANYFKWFEIGRAEYMRDIGIPYKNWENEGYFLPVVECGCKFFAPVNYDDKVKIAVSIDPLKRTSVRFKYQLFNKDGTLFAEGFTHHVCLDKDGKMIKIPDNYSNLFRLNMKKFDKKEKKSLN